MQRMFLASANLASLPHGFFTRKGGASTGIYASLNCGQGSGDDPAHVLENRERVRRMLGAKDVLSVYQVHGDNVIRVESAWGQEDRPQADAMVTSTPGIALGILAADCAPVLFADAANGVIGAAHAGWKGALSGVLARTVEAMQALGATGISAAIGPCIGPASYEVGGGFHDAFLLKDAEYAAYFREAEKPGHYLFDLRSYAKAQLAKAGVKDINALENDTYIEEDDFFSFRRATHRKEPDYGRQISAIMLPSGT